MINVVRISVPAVTEYYQHRIEDAIIEMTGWGGEPKYEEDENGRGVVRLLATDNELEWIKKCFKNVEVDHVSSFTMEWYTYKSNTWVQVSWKLEADGSASVRRRNNIDSDEEPVELSSVSEEEFHKIFEEYFLGERSAKLVQWD